MLIKSLKNTFLLINIIFFLFACSRNSINFGINNRRKKISHNKSLESSSDHKKTNKLNINNINRAKGNFKTENQETTIKQIVLKFIDNDIINDKEEKNEEINSFNQGNWYEFKINLNNEEKKIEISPLEYNQLKNIGYCKVKIKDPTNEEDEIFCEYINIIKCNDNNYKYNHTNILEYNNNEYNYKTVKSVKIIKSYYNKIKSLQQIFINMDKIDRYNQNKLKKIIIGIQTYIGEKEFMNIYNLAGRPKITYVNEFNGVGGYYNQVNHIINISLKLSVEDIISSLIHELTHAVDFRNTELCINNFESNLLSNAYKAKSKISSILFYKSERQENYNKILKKNYINTIIDKKYLNTEFKLRYKIPQAFRSKNGKMNLIKVLNIIGDNNSKSNRYNPFIIRKLSHIENRGQLIYIFSSLISLIITEVTAHIVQVYYSFLKKNKGDKILLGKNNINQSIFKENKNNFIKIYNTYINSKIKVNMSYTEIYNIISQASNTDYNFIKDLCGPKGVLYKNYTIQALERNCDLFNFNNKMIGENFFIEDSYKIIENTNDIIQLYSVPYQQVSIHKESNGEVLFIVKACTIE